MHQTIAYTYQNAPIPGGGYVTGFVFHRKQPGILYARTDIGGTYRFDGEQKRWVSLIDHVTEQDLSLTYPIALALDDSEPDRLYIVSGIYGEDHGTFSISEDRGGHFVHKTIPTPVHGNLSGRGTGYRLVVDRNDGNTLYFASQLGGLWKTTNQGDSWTRLNLQENYTTFVWVSDDSKTIVCGTAGYTNRLGDTLRGHSLYVSYDAGATFEKLPMPENVIVPDSKMNGLVASRYDFDGTYLYVTMNSTGRWNYIVPLGYSCDTGDVIGGRVVRYRFENGRIAGFDDITPEGGSWLNYGFGGICSCPAMPGLLACSTLCKEKESPEIVYISRDYGKTWQESLNGLEKGGIHFRTSYMKPEFNGGVSLLHWLSDVKIDPFDPDRLWFNSGTGVFKTDALLAENPAYHDWCDGIEETVHLNVYAPISGQVRLVDIVGDLGGFAFRELDKPCRNSFDDAEGNRYITCINADISDFDSNLAIITARGNWKGKTKGGLVRTRDGFHTFEKLPIRGALATDVVRQIEFILRPNVNPGWVAQSPDGVNIVWSVADNIRLPVAWVIVSNNGGSTFHMTRVYDLQGQPATNGCMKVYSDRLDSSVFYGFGEAGQVYVSRDGGVTYYEKQTCLPKVDFGLIDCANKTEVRGVAGEKGLFYMALGENGMWKFRYDSEKDTVFCQKLSAEGDSCLRLGLGVGRPGGDYVADSKAIYLCGVVDGEYGFYRTLDEGKTYARLNNKNQMYGQINSIDGDKRKFGRFFLATGSRGVLYGEEMEEG